MRNAVESMYFNVSSVTNAMRGKKLLEKNGIHGYIHRTVDEEGNNGCGYSLLVSGDVARAEKLLIGAGIRIRGKQPAGTGHGF